MATYISELALRIEPISKDRSCGEAYQHFQQDPDLLTVAVVDGARPVGLVDRHAFLTRMSHEYGHALFDRKPVCSLMDRQPLVVDANIGFEALTELIISEKPSALLKGFIISEGGQYLGVGTALGLLRFSSECHRARALELEAARMQAEQANAAKTQFLASMSHELRTPLNAIIGFSEMIHEETMGVLENATYKEYAQDINKSGLHLLSLVNDLLDIARIEAGHMRFEEEVCDLEEIIEDCEIQVRTRAERAGIRLGAHVAHRLPKVMADPRKLRQILINLLTNAVKFTLPGGEIWVHARLTNRGCLVVSVEDSGIGVAKEDIPRILEKFGQADDGYGRAREGVGLGLPICKALAEMHGGQLGIESVVGQGTKVYFSLPLERIVPQAA